MQSDCPMSCQNVLGACRLCSGLEPLTEQPGHEGNLKSCLHPGTCQDSETGSNRQLGVYKYAYCMMPTRCTFAARRPCRRFLPFPLNLGASVDSPWLRIRLQAAPGALDGLPSSVSTSGGPVFESRTGIKHRSQPSRGIWNELACLALSTRARARGAGDVFMSSFLRSATFRSFKVPGFLQTRQTLKPIRVSH